MQNNKNKIDILGDVMSTRTHEAIPDIGKLTEIINLISLEQKTEHKKISERKVVGSKRQRVQKKKSTYYLTEKVFEELHGAKDLIKTILPEDIDVRVTMSEIVNYSLKWMLKELEEKKEYSKVVKHFKTD